MKKTRAIGTTGEAIRAAETALGRMLPTSFSEWLLDNNGIAWNGLSIFPVFDPRDPRKTWDSIVRNFNEGWQQWRDNFSDCPVDFSRLLPFAEFGTGDYFCFDYEALGDAGEPKVVLWSHETGETSPIADSFAEILAKPDLVR